MDPINYTRDVQTPFQAALQGYQGGAAIRNDQMAQQQQQLALQQQQQQQQVIRSLLANPNPTAGDYANATLLVPGMKDQFKQSWDMRSTAQQQGDLSHASEVYSALAGDRPDIAIQILKQRAQGLRNSGNPDDAAHADTMVGVIEHSPKFARTMLGMQLSSIPGGDKVVGGISTLGGEQRAEDQAGADLAKKTADASKATTDAGIAAANAPASLEAPILDNRMKAEQIKSAANERKIADLNVQIAQANSETERGRLTLERDKLRNEINKTSQTQTVDAQTTMDTLGNTLSTIDALMKHPGLTGENASWSGGAGTILGKLRAQIPGSDDKDFRAQLDTLKSQEFLTSIQQMKGMGALSDAEGAKVSSAVANLDPDQSVGQLKNALGVIRATVQRGQAKLIASGKLAPAGGAFVLKHPQFGNVSEGDINRLLEKNPGSTREQVMQYLQSTGGK